MAGITIYLIVELLVSQPVSVASGIALAVLSALAGVWLGFMAVHTLRGSPWIRGAAIVWQVLQGAIAIYSFQGPAPRTDVGWLLLLPAIVIVVLLFTKPVIAATTRPEER
jgi:hypothetical protein